jgi:glycosyltransferase involved in cell wall biosynthesis
MSNSDIIISVCMITYNHESFIERAIQGVLQQKTNLTFEIVIGEDHSIDNTRDICEKYVRIYPNLIRLLPSSAPKGMSLNFLDTIKQCKGKYIAFCEGDDYWTDQNKLQMQVDFLERNQDYVLSCTYYKTFDTNLNRFINEENDLSQLNISGESFDLERAFSKWITKTLTVVYRSKVFDPFTLPVYKYFRDVHLIFHLLKSGKGYLHHTVTGVYNLHDSGSWSPLSLRIKALMASKVCYEIYKFNKSNQVIRNRYLLSLRELINISVELSTNPLFNKGIYIIMFKYMKEIQSFSFLKEHLRLLLKKQFS